MSSHKETTRLHHLLPLFFGDETLSFHSQRMQEFFLAAFAEPDEDYQPRIPKLLHAQHDLLRLIDAAHLLWQHFDPMPQTNDTNVSHHIKRIRAVLENWDDFPSHLHSSEWGHPEVVLEEFFAMQSVDEWKDVVMALLQSAIGEGSPFTSLSEWQWGFAISMLQRLQDAVWVLWVTGRVPAAEDVEEGEFILETVNA